MADKFLEQAWVTWKLKYLTGGDVPLLELYSMKLAFVAGWYAAQQSAHSTLLTERKIDLYCPHCGKKFGIALPASQSG